MYLNACFPQSQREKEIERCINGMYIALMEKSEKAFCFYPLDCVFRTAATQSNGKSNEIVTMIMNKLF